MKLVIAYIQPEKLKDVKQALFAADIKKMSVTNSPLTVCTTRNAYCTTPTQMRKTNDESILDLRGWLRAIGCFTFSYFVFVGSTCIWHPSETPTQKIKGRSSRLSKPSFHANYTRSRDKDNICRSKEQGSSGGTLFQEDLRTVFPAT